MDPVADDVPFLIDAGGDSGIDPVSLGEAAAAAERDGYDGIAAAETKHDAFVALTVAATATSRIQLLSGIAVAFARNPMSVALAANDLQLVAGGRFVLGLGSQVKAHIERRFSMPWSAPATRMAEFVRAVRAIHEAWATGGRLAFRGEFYTHTLMTPFFDPGPNPYGPPPVWLAAVGERMTRAAGETADGLLAHSFTTATYLNEVSLPALAAGAAAAGRPVPQVAVPAFVAIADDGAALDRAVTAVKAQIAFYGSTPAYLPVLELHGWADLHERLNAAVRRGEWATLPGLVPDDVAHAFAAIGTPAEVASQLRERFAGRIARLSFNAPSPAEPEQWAVLLAALRAPAR